jgi:hypothetical protein
VEFAFHVQWLTGKSDGVLKLKFQLKLKLQLKLFRNRNTVHTKKETRQEVHDDYTGQAVAQESG